MTYRIKKHRSGCHKVTIPLYERSFYVALSIDAAENLTDDSYDCEMGMVQEFDGDPPLMLLVDKSANTVAHECGHVALIMSNLLGMTATYEDQEPFCYILGFIAEHVAEVIRRDS